MGARLRTLGVTSVEAGRSHPDGTYPRRWPRRRHSEEVTRVVTLPTIWELCALRAEAGRSRSVRPAGTYPRRWPGRRRSEEVTRVVTLPNIWERLRFRDT